MDNGTLSEKNLLHFDVGDKLIDSSAYQIHAKVSDKYDTGARHLLCKKVSITLRIRIL